MENQNYHFDHSKYILDASEDYRLLLPNFKIDRRGNLWCKRWGNTPSRKASGSDWQILIPRKQLAENDWLCHMEGKGYVDFGEFVRAYLAACELAGIASVNVLTRCFSDGHKFADE